MLSKRTVALSKEHEGQTLIFRYDIHRAKGQNHVLISVNTGFRGEGLLTYADVIGSKPVKSQKEAENFANEWIEAFLAKLSIVNKEVIMSVTVVSHAHLNAVCNFLREHCNPITDQILLATVKDWLELNYASYLALYPDEAADPTLITAAEDFEDFRLAPGPAPEPMAAAKLIYCIGYQMDNAPNYEAHPGWGHYQRAQKLALQALGWTDTLEALIRTPEWEQAPWVI